MGLLRTYRRLIDRFALWDKSFRFLFEHDDTGEYVALDCETTGLDPWADDIIAVAAVKIRGRRVLASERFEALVRFDHAMAADAIKVHRLRGMDLAAGRPIYEVLPDLLRFIGPRPIVGYYIDFDIRMVDKYLLEWLNIYLPNPRIEVSELYYAAKYHRAPPGTTIDLRFATVLADLGIPERPEHDAFNDALAAALAYIRLSDLAARGEHLRREPDREPHLAPARPIASPSF